MIRFINIKGAYLGEDLQGSQVAAFLEGILKEEDLLGILDGAFLADIPTFLVVDLLDIHEVAYRVASLVASSLEGILAFLEEVLPGILPFSTC